MLDHNGFRGESMNVVALKEDWLLDGCVRDGARIGSDWIPLRPPLIDGVCFRETRPVLAGYGALTEIYRREWEASAIPVDQIFASTMRPGALTAWHAHEATIDRLAVAQGTVRIVLYDSRRGSPSYGRLNEFLVSTLRPALVTIPARVWHGVQNAGDEVAVLLNAVDRAYDYAAPDHWRLPPDSPQIPYRFSR